MSDDPFLSPKRSIRHALEEIDEAESRAIAYFQAGIARLVEADPKSGENVHKFRLTGQFPDKIEMILKDAVGALRDALDHAVYSATKVLSGGDPKRTGFPFARDAAGVNGQLNGRSLGGNAPELRPFLAALQPHEGGNALLWGLNSIRNPGTHRFVVPIGSAVMMGGLTIRSGLIRGGSIGYSRWDTAKQEVEFMRLSPDSRVDYQVRPAFNVAFEGSHALSGQPAFGTLREIAAEVERVVLAIEAETARIIRERP